MVARSTQMLTYTIFPDKPSQIDERLHGTISSDAPAAVPYVQTKVSYRAASPFQK